MAEDSLARTGENLPAEAVEQQVLARMEAAREALAEAHTLGQAKQIADLAATMVEWLRRQSDVGLYIVNDGNQLKLEAEHRMGGFLNQPGVVREQDDGLSRKVTNVGCLSPPSHQELGIKQQDAYRYRELTRLPVETLGELARAATAKKRELTRADVLRVAAEIEREERRQEVVTAAAEVTLPEDLAIWEGDFREVGARIEPGSVDLIFTDPPYDRKAASLYADLSQFAARVLRPGGLCMAYSGHAHLPQVLGGMSASLEYLWTCAVIHSGEWLRFFKFHLFVGWKPVVLFGKPPVEAWWDWLPDLASGGQEKDAHPWQQAVGEAEHFLARLCPPGGIVVDPCLGSGTTLVAAARLGLRGIGIEEDGEDLAIARSRLAALPEAGR